MGFQANPFEHGGLMRHATLRRVSRQVESLRTQFAQVQGLPFADILSSDLINQILAAQPRACRQRVYTPLVTLALMLTQSQDDDPSLRQAVARLQAQRALQQRPAIDPGT